MSGFGMYCVFCDGYQTVFAFPKCSKCGETVMICEKEECWKKHKCKAKK